MVNKAGAVVCATTGLLVGAVLIGMSPNASETTAFMIDLIASMFFVAGIAGLTGHFFYTRDAVDLGDIFTGAMRWIGFVAFTLMLVCALVMILFAK